MNEFYFIIAIVGIFSSLNGYIVGIIHRNIMIERKIERAFKSGYMRGSWGDVDVDEAFFRWKNNIIQDTKREEMH